MRSHWVFPRFTGGGSRDARTALSKLRASSKETPTERTAEGKGDGQGRRTATHEKQHNPRKILRARDTVGRVPQGASRAPARALFCPANAVERYVRPLRIRGLFK